MRVFWQYVLRWFVEDEQEACDVEFRNTRRELAVHLRSGDLLHLPNISSRSLMASCLLAFATHKALDTSQFLF